MEFLEGFLTGLLLGLLGGTLVAGYVYYLVNNRRMGSCAARVKAVVRDEDAWTGKLAALEEQYGPLDQEIVFSHYEDDISDNAFVFEDAQTLLLMGQPLAYRDLEKVTFEYAGVYIVKIWVEGLEGHYLTVSTDNPLAARTLYNEVERICGSRRAA